jgi:hypothetical protein
MATLSRLYVFLLLQLALRLWCISHMLERDREKRILERLEKVNISGSLPPSISLLRDLIKFLNESRTSRGKRIVHILEQMLELDAITKPIDGIVWANMSLRKTNPKKYQLLWEVEKKRAFLNRDLAKYRFVPRAEVGVGGGGEGGGASEWFAWWKGDPRQRPEKHLRLVASEALELILKLTQIGHLDRLRHCAHCGNWLYAKFRHQTFCSMRCQQKHYAESEEFRARRRDYMRRRYHRLMKS